MSDIRLNWDNIVMLLAQGNPFIWLLLAITLFCLGVLAWIKYEQPLRRLGSVILRHCSGRYRAKAERQLEVIELCNLRYEKFAEKIYGLICRISDLQIDRDPGRNRFYQYLVKTMFEAFFKGFTTMYNDYRQGKIKNEDFTSYRKTHHHIACGAIDAVQKVVRQKLSGENWSEDKIAYINEMFKVWMSSHVGLLRELLSSDEMSIEVVKTWWVFFYEMFMDVEKFGLMINGRITGLAFDGQQIKENRYE